MNRRNTNGRTKTLIALTLLTLLAAHSRTCRIAEQGFVTRSGTNLTFNGRPYRFSGANNPYLASAPNFEVEDVLATAASNGLRVLRVWGFIDVGDPRASDSVDGPKRNVFFQFWNGSTPAFNNGPNGLQKLDHLILRSGRLNLKLIMVLTNNWSEFGGMDQYVRWKGASFHDDFYRDPTIKSWYKAYTSHVLNRVNVYTGIPYKDDPTILAWELANEPRCQGTGLFPAAADCDVALITGWAAEMSKHLKNLDANHLVGVGDEGFYCVPHVLELTENCATGVDTLALGGLSSVDYVSVHLYPDDWGKSPEWGTRWIARHIADAQILEKPVVLGEFGVRDRATRLHAYRAWTNLLWERGGAGDAFWMLAGRQKIGGPYPTDDRYVVHCGSDPLCGLIRRHAERMSRRGLLHRVFKVLKETTTRWALGQPVRPNHDDAVPEPSGSSPESSRSDNTTVQELGAVSRLGASLWDPPQLICLEIKFLGCQAERAATWAPRDWRSTTMKILVTGGAGYVGSILCPLLLNQGHFVTLFDTFLWGVQPVLHFADHERLTIVCADVRDPQAITRAVASSDCVIHLAAIVGYPACDADPAAAESTNVGGTRNICETVSSSQMLIYASTGSVYGRCPTICTETLPIAPLTVYGRTKAAAENMVLEKGGVALRFATLFGISPRVRLDLLVNNLCYEAAHSGVLELFEAHHRRTFLHVRDGAAAYAFAIAHYRAMSGEIYNVGASCLNATKLEIAHMIQRVHPCELRTAPTGTDRDARDYEVSYDKLAALGYRSSVMLEEGVRDILRLVPFLTRRPEWQNAA